jgi:carboxymethylenebutenolidase
MSTTVPLVLTLLVLATAASGAEDPSYPDRMAELHRNDEPRPSPAAQIPPADAVRASEVVYATVDGAEVRGYLAQPEEVPGGRPGVIVIQEWWGLNDNIRAMARRLAGHGYAALAVDLYGGRVAEDPAAARELMQGVMSAPEGADENLRQAYAYLSGKMRAPRVGVIGWCFGGGWALRTGLLLPDRIDAMVIYYGQLVTDEQQLSTLEMPIIGFFGAEDRGIPVDTVRQFEAALDGLGKEASIHVYPGAGHAFANPSGTRYQPEAATDAWSKTLAFLEKTLQP